MSNVNRPKSLAAFERAQRSIPGGVNSPARAFGAVGGSPLFIASAEGPYLYDLDGKRYLDFVGSWGPMILGHAHPEVVAAAIEAVKQGSSYGAPCELETELAEMVIDAVPSIEMVRFVSSGTEATMSAIRLARGYTGRDKIIKFAGCYHGHVDSLLVAAGSSALTHGVPSSPGVPKGCTDDTLLLRFNDSQQLADAFKSHGNQIAAVIIEPVAGNMGLVPLSAEFRKVLRRLTHEHGALLIYDEVMTGFRLAYGGAQELLLTPLPSREGLREGKGRAEGKDSAGTQPSPSPSLRGRGEKSELPDLTCLGKIIGGGYPVGAYGGRADIMKRIMPAGPVFQAGTLSGNPVAMAAGIATLKILKRDNPYRRLDALGQRLEASLAAAARAANVPHCFNRLGSMWTLFFAPSPVVDYDTARASDVKMFSRFFWAMMDRGYYLPCSQFEAAFLMTAMDEAMIDGFIHAASESLRN